MTRNQDVFKLGLTLLDVMSLFMRPKPTREGSFETFNLRFCERNRMLHLCHNVGCPCHGQLLILICRMNSLIIQRKVKTQISK